MNVNVDKSKNSIESKDSGHLPLYIVVMTGGERNRLWPHSNSETPKQFQNFFGGSALLRNAWKNHFMDGKKTNCREQCFLEY